MRCCLDDRTRRPCRILALEDAGADEDALRAQMHGECRVGGRGDPAGHEVDHRQLAVGGDILDQLVGRLQVLGRDEKLVLAHALQLADA